MSKPARENNKHRTFSLLDIDPGFPGSSFSDHGSDEAVGSLGASSEPSRPTGSLLLPGGASSPRRSSPPVQRGGSTNISDISFDMSAVGHELDFLVPPPSAGANRRNNRDSNIGLSPGWGAGFVPATSASSGNNNNNNKKSKRGFFYSRAWKEHKKRRKEQKKLLLANSPGGAGGGGVDAASIGDEIYVYRDLTRRKRNSFHKDARRGGGWIGLGETNGKVLDRTNATAYLAARIESERPYVSDVYNHSAAIFAASTKPHMMDVSLAGRDVLPVYASKFILACYSPVLEQVFYRGREWPEYDAKASTLTIKFVDAPAIRAAVHHCFTGELPADFGPIASPSQGVARGLARLDRLAHEFKFAALGEVTYRALRKLINGRGVLACAIFDELSSQKNAEDSIKRYALDTMREMPMDTLLGGGVQWMKEESVEAIIQDQDMDVDEFYMFKILKAWASAKDYSGEDRLEVARRLSKHIELNFIDPDLLLREVRDSGYFNERLIADAVRLVEDSCANHDPCEMERVLVEGAGTEIVNGIYFRVKEETGMGEEEILFVKEADDGYSDVGLFLWGTSWHIAMCADYSNCFYSCKELPLGERSSEELVPERDWEITAADEPPPMCTYLPNVRMTRTSEGREPLKLAPNLEEMMDPTIAEKRRSEYFDRRNDDVIEKRQMTLEQMMNLPEDLGASLQHLRS